jgi:hypothetical protein
MLSLLCHVSTFIPITNLSMSNAWPLHLGAIVVFGAMVMILVAKKKGKRPARESGESYLTWWSNSIYEDQNYMTVIIRSVPMTIRILCAGVFLYTLVNFALFMINSEGGGPFAENDKYYLKSHGHIIRELSEQEFYRFRAYELRGFSGHWILFSLIPTIYFAHIRRTDDTLENISKSK